MQDVVVVTHRAMITGVTTNVPIIVFIPVTMPGTIRDPNPFL